MYIYIYIYIYVQSVYVCDGERIHCSFVLAAISCCSLEYFSSPEHLFDRVPLWKTITVCLYIHYIYIYIRIYTYICIYIYIHICISCTTQSLVTVWGRTQDSRTQTYVCMYVCTYVCVNVCIHIYISQNLYM